MVLGSILDLTHVNIDEAYRGKGQQAKWIGEGKRVRTVLIRDIERGRSLLSRLRRCSVFKMRAGQDFPQHHFA